MFKPHSTDECTARYGPLRFSSELGLHWPEAPKWISPWKVPDPVVLKLQTGQRVHRIFANKDIHAPLTAAFHDLIQTGAYAELITFDGCFNVRWVRGNSGIPSYHSWGIALDFNATHNPLGAERGSFSETFLDCWRDAGFRWGGDFSGRKDPMHLEWTAKPLARNP
jgi:hypothetical protein